MPRPLALGVTYSSSLFRVQTAGLPHSPIIGRNRGQSRRGRRRTSQAESAPALRHSCASLAAPKPPERERRTCRILTKPECDRRRRTFEDVTAVVNIAQQATPQRICTRFDATTRTNQLARSSGRRMTRLMARLSSNGRMTSSDLISSRSRKSRSGAREVPNSST